VVTHYNWEEAANPLLLALGLPTGLFAISISILSFWYCPSCEERGKNKRPCRARYQTTRAHDIDLDQQPHPQRSNSRGRRREGEQQNPQIPPIVQQPRGKDLAPQPPNQQQRSPSLATISSKDTTVSSVNSMDDGYK
jgi:hypothetical protein